MSGPGVSESKTATGCDNPHVEFVSTVYQPDSQYCVNGTHTDNGDTASSSDCTTSPAAPPRITSVAFERIQTDDLPIDVNPNTGGGLRLFPDDKIPNDPVDRRKIRVRAKLSAANGGVPIYFRSYDLDDPFTDALPIDPNNNAGNDNNGNVDGMPSTRAGQFTVLNGTGCDVSPLGFSCPTNSAGEAVAEFTTTMQPGDNFAVAASADSGYLGGVTIDGVNLKDAANAQIPVTTAANNFCQNSTIKACRAEMLTVWRRLHIEVDSMGNVTNNKVDGTIPIGKKYRRTATFTVDISANEALEENRLQNGRIVIGSDSYKINSNTVSTPPVPPATGHAATLTLQNNFGNPQLSLPNNQPITLYDDDDFNDNDGDTKVGDNNELVQRFANNLKHLLSEDGNYEDNSPKNVLGVAYIRPTYTWASTYDSNVPFDLNVEYNELSSNTPTSLINASRGSRAFESDEFWLAYVIFGYQGTVSEDFDPIGIPLVGASPALTCDCYSNANCPAGRISCSNSIPRGGPGSVIFLETSQDYRKFWLNPPSPYSPKVFNEAETTVPHELGHQLGLKGYVTSEDFKIMDYVQPQFHPTGNIQVGFNDEHINILRRRIKSPGEL